VRGRIRRTLAFDKIKRQLGRWLLIFSRLTAPHLKPVLEELAKNLQKFVLERARPGPGGPKPHRHHAYKGS
jgi:hypothetical protein